MAALATRRSETGRQGTSPLGSALARGEPSHRQPSHGRYARRLSAMLCYCPWSICSASVSQTHILCYCPGLAAERAGLDQELALIVNRLPPGPGCSLGRAIHNLLFRQRDIAHRGHLWTGLWTPQQRALLGPHLRRCTLREGQRILQHLSTWAATRVPVLWTHFQEHAEALRPLPTLSTTLPDAHTDYPDPPDIALDLPAPDMPIQPARDLSSPPPKRRRLDRPPPEPPPHARAPTPLDHASSRPQPFNMATVPPCSPRSPRSPWTHLAGADHG